MHPVASNGGIRQTCSRFAACHAEAREGGCGPVAGRVGRAGSPLPAARSGDRRALAAASELHDALPANGLYGTAFFGLQKKS